MSKKYIQKPAEKPGAMILAELIEQEIKNGDLKWNKDTQRYERNDRQENNSISVRYIQSVFS